MAGCGDEEGDGTAPATSAASDVEFVLDADGEAGAEAQRASVVCEATGGPPECALIDALPEDPAAPTPPETACTEIYGGPDYLTVRGELRGEPIDAAFTRADGCEIERYDRFAPILKQLFPAYRPGEDLRP